MKIEMVDLHGQHKKIHEEINEKIEQVIDSCKFINGPQVKEFCEHLAVYNRVKHVIPCGNGTDAIQIALMALDLKTSDEVIVPVHTYVATAEVIALLGLTPVFVDCEDSFFTIDVSQIESKITPRTKAIVPVHLYGQCCEMETLLQIAKKHNLYVIEDSAQAIGAEYQFSDGRTTRAGCMGDIGTTSFFPSKNLGCYGDGGALFIENDELAAKVRMIANHGQRVKYHHDIIGCNSRLDTLQAAILDVKLKYLDSYKEARQQVANDYNQALKEIKDIILPQCNPRSSHVFHQYTIRIPNNQRDQLKEYLADKGIPTMIYYPVPLHLQKAYRQENAAPGTFPVSERLCNEVLSLPIHTEMTKEQIKYITSLISKFFQS